MLRRRSKRELYVLVAARSVDRRIALEEALVNEEIGVTVCAAVDEARAFLRSLRFDALIIDSDLRRGEAGDILGRQHGSVNKVPTVFLGSTVAPDLADVVLAADAPADTVLRAVRELLALPAPTPPGTL